MGTGIIKNSMKLANFILQIFNMQIQFKHTGTFPVTINSLGTSHTIEKILKKLIQSNIHDQFYFVQIGANDGYSFDPIHECIIKYQLTGICIEPIESYFNELKITYKAYPQVKLIQNAISETNGPILMHKVIEEASLKLPTWTKGIASIHEDHHQRTGIPKFAIETETVHSITFEALIQQENITHIDLLVLDTEGYDIKILSMIDFSQIKPTIIFFEHLYNHHAISDNELGELVTNFQERGYLVHVGASEMLVYLP